MPKTLVQKLYLREGHRAAVIDAPQGYESILGDLPRNVTMAVELSGTFDWIQYFVVKRSDLESEFDNLKGALTEGAPLWIAYPKAGQRDTDLNRDPLATIAGTYGLRPVAQVSVDETWSALRFKVADWSDGLLDEIVVDSLWRCTFASARRERGMTDG